MEGHDGHEDLRGSGCRSVIPYVYESVLYCCVCAVQAVSWTCVELRLRELVWYWRLAGPFIAQGWTITMRPKARQVAPGQVKPYAVGY
jgi:hypothetical protein